MSTEMQALIERLEQVAARVRELDLEAVRQLHEINGRERHRLLLLEKAELLASLHGLARESGTALPEDRRRGFEEAIVEIAEDAMRAKAIGSVFYMSVLLQSEEEGAEGLNDLEKLIAWLLR